VTDIEGKTATKNASFVGRMQLLMLACGFIYPCSGCAAAAIHQGIDQALNGHLTPIIAAMASITLSQARRLFARNLRCGQLLISSITQTSILDILMQQVDKIKKKQKSGGTKMLIPRKASHFRLQFHDFQRIPQNNHTNLFSTAKRSGEAL